jgi:hypothetical protein
MACHQGVRARTLRTDDCGQSDSSEALHDPDGTRSDRQEQRVARLLRGRASADAWRSNG